MTRDRDELVRGAMTVDDALDDIKRAHIWSRIEGRLTADAPVRAWWRTLVPAGALVVAMAVAVLVIGRSPHERDGDALAAPAGATLSTPLGPYARASLIGPAHVDLVERGETTTARLRSGTLLAEFSGGPGRVLRVEAPGLTVVVVGTLFAIEAREGKPTCVSVAHGRVRVEARGTIAPVFVAGGERWCGGDVSVSSILAETAAALTRHEAATATNEREPQPTPVAVPVVAQVETPHVVTPAPTPRVAMPSVTPPAVVDLHPQPAPVPVRAHVDATPAPAVATSSPAMPTAPRVNAAPAQPVVVSEPAPTGPPPAVITATPSPSTPAHVDAPASAPVPPPAPPTPPARPSPASPDDLYAAAESALAHGDRAAAERALADLATRFPTSPILDQALYERAQLAYRRHGYAEAQAALASLAHLSSTPLAEPGAYLACRIDVETHDSSAHACIVAYRDTYPRSPHDLDLLGWLAEEAMHDGGCDRAAPLVHELVDSYRTSQLAHAWQRRCPKPP